MAEQSPEDAAHLEQIAVTLRRRLRVLELQCTRYGVAVPPHVLLEREDTERDLAHALRELRRLKPAAPSEHSPYLGLLTFDEQHSAFFFGRDDVITQLLDQAQHTSFLAVLGPSGSGKSSVVRAGIVPALKNGALPESERWHYAVMKPGARPLDALAVELARLLHHDVVALRTALAESPRAVTVQIYPSLTFYKSTMIWKSSLNSGYFTTWAGNQTRNRWTFPTLWLLSKVFYPKREQLPGGVS